MKTCCNNYRATVLYTNDSLDLIVRMVISQLIHIFRESLKDTLDYRTF
jgi:hypothetical protein